MTCMEKINGALEYIEANIAGEIDVKQAARRACCSEYHFLRVFAFIAEIPLSEYIRRRRLTLAAFELINSNVKIISVAAKYGYDSPAAFSRAFKKMHGISPANVWNTDAELKAYPKLSLNVLLNGDKEISYKIVPQKAYELCGIVRNIPVSPEESNKLITSFWEENIQNGVLGQFHRDIGLAYDVCLNTALFDREPDMFKYMICYERPRFGVPNGYSSLSVPPHTWAVFSTPEHSARENTESIRHLRERIFAEWFPTSGYMLANGPEFEIFKKESNQFVIDIWIPITKALTDNYRTHDNIRI